MDIVSSTLLRFINRPYGTGGRKRLKTIMINIEQAREVIENLENSFSSHDFIQKFKATKGGAYLNDILRDSPSDIHKEHAAIGRFLSTYMDRLKIKKNGRTLSENVFGRMNEVQLWKKKEEL